MLEYSIWKTHHDLNNSMYHDNNNKIKEVSEGMLTHAVVTVGDEIVDKTKNVVETRVDAKVEKVARDVRDDLE